MNFILFFKTRFIGIDSLIDGKQALNSPGSILKQLTEMEHVRIKSSNMRLITGHVMVFYCLALSILWPIKSSR
jgi:hypothetical protein